VEVCTVKALLQHYDGEREYRGYTIKENGQYVYIWQDERAIATLDKRVVVTSMGEFYVDQVVEQMCRHMLENAAQYIMGNNELRDRIKHFLETTRRT
jgi:hypothetical protein